MTESGMTEWEVHECCSLDVVLLYIETQIQFSRKCIGDSPGPTDRVLVSNQLFLRQASSRPLFFLPWNCSPPHICRRGFTEYWRDIDVPAEGHPLKGGPERNS